MKLPRVYRRATSLIHFLGQLSLFHLKACHLFLKTARGSRKIQGHTRQGRKVSEIEGKNHQRQIWT